MANSTRLHLDAYFTGARRGNLALHDLDRSFWLGNLRGAHLRHGRNLRRISWSGRCTASKPRDRMLHVCLSQSAKLWEIFVALNRTAYQVAERLDAFPSRRVTVCSRRT